MLLLIKMFTRFCYQIHTWLSFFKNSLVPGPIIDPSGDYDADAMDDIIIHNSQDSSLQRGEPEQERK